MKGINHISLKSKDVDRTLRFYLEGFEGARVRYKFGEAPKLFYMVELCPGVVLELLPRPYGDEPINSRWEHIAIQCSDINAEFERLVKAGGHPKRPVYEWTMPGEPPCRCFGAFVVGPEGETIELCQAIESEFPWL